MMKALIFEGRVVEVAKKEYPVHPSMVWVDCDKNVQSGYTYDGAFHALVVDVTLEIKAALDASDKGMARVAEDVISVLIAKGLLTVDDLPATVKDKLSERDALRKALK